MYPDSLNSTEYRVQSQPDELGLENDLPRPRIGIYMPKFGPGGPARYVDGILNSVDPREFELLLVSDDSIVSSEHRKTEVRLSAKNLDSSRSSEVRLARWGSGIRAFGGAFVPTALKRIAGFYASARRLAEVFRHARLDLLHTQNTGCEESPVAARLAGISRVLGTFHVDSTYDLARVRSGPSYRLLEFVSNHSLHHAIAVSEAAKLDWARRTALRQSFITTIHNGIDASHFRRRNMAAEARALLDLPTQPSIVIATVGRLAPEKGTAYLLEAFAAIASVYSSAVLAIAGSGPLQEGLAAEAARLGIVERVRWLGFQSDVRLLLEAADIFVMPSLCETIGYSHMEAAAMQLPVVATRVGGIPEVVIDGETGLLVEPRNPSELFQALTTLIESPEMRRSLGQAGRTRIKSKFREEDMARRTLEIYRKMLCDPPLRNGT